MNAPVTLHASVSPGELRVAAWAGQLVDYAISRPGSAFEVGERHRGRIIARVPAMAGAFVALEGGEGFLPDSEAGAGKALSGAIIGVRITRAPQGGKGPRLSARLTADEQAAIGTGPPARIAPAPDALDRLAALWPNSPVVIDDAARARATTNSRIVPRAWTDAIEQAVDTLASPSVSLPGAGSMTITPTPALIAIDVDLGALAGQRGDKASSHVDGNRAIIPEICRQIRLRNLAGAIVIDLAGLSLRKRQALAPDFTAALAQDRLSPKFLGFSALGLAEIMRPRLHAPLHELLGTPHAEALAALRHIDREVAAQPHLSPILRCSPAVGDALRRDSQALRSFAQRAGRDLIVIEDRALPNAAWRMETK